MTLSELHPDELLWRDACGTLTAAERADLTDHLQRCPACALERVVRVEAARARVPSEADHAMAARLVDRVLATQERRPVAAMRAGWRRPLAVTAAAVLLLAGTAFAATALVVRVRAQRATRVLALGRQEAPTEATARRRSEVRPDGRSPDTVRAADIGTSPGDVPVPRPVSPARDHRWPRDNSPSKARLLRSGALAHAPSAEGVSSPLVPHPPVESAPAVVEPQPLEAPQLLRLAERERTARHWADADRAFADLGRRYPGTREEIVGRALYGQLLLDQLAEPRRALTMFERYLAIDSSGALAEEVRVGRAQALQRLGRSREERSAWLELLREHPGSVHASTARTRLAALAAP